MTYDAAHTSSWPLALGAAGVVANEPTLVQVGLIWLAHIGLTGRWDTDSGIRPIPDRPTSTASSAGR